MARPSPAPPNSRVVVPSTWKKTSKTRARFWGAMPMPESTTWTATRSAPSARAWTVTDPPDGVNFTAFVTRLMSDCRIFSRSHWTGGRWAGCQVTRSPFFRACGVMVATASLMTVFTSTSETTSFTRLASILEMSRMEVMSPSRLSPLSMMI